MQRFLTNGKRKREKEKNKTKKKPELSTYSILAYEREANVVEKIKKRRIKGE